MFTFVLTMANHNPGQQWTVANPALTTNNTTSNWRVSHQTQDYTEIKTDWYKWAEGNFRAGLINDVTPIMPEIKSTDNFFKLIKLKK